MSTPYSASIIVSPAGNGQAGVTISPGGLPGPQGPALGPSDWLNVVTKYGADPTGSTDSTTAFQNAINAAQSVPGSVVWYPPGKYVCDAPLNADSTKGLAMLGPGGLSGGAYAAARITFTYAGSASALSARSSAGFILQGVQVLYNNAGFNGYLIDLSHATASDSALFRIRDCVLGGNIVKTAAAVIFTNQADTGAVEGCNIINAVDGIYGITSDGSYSNQVTVSGSNQFSGLSGASIRNPGNGWSISGNTFEALSSGEAGAVLCDSGVHTYGTRITGNWLGDITTPGGTQIAVNGAGFGISGNFIGYGTGNTGIAVGANSSGFTVKGNYFSAASGATAISLGSGCTGYDCGQNATLNPAVFPSPLTDSVTAGSVSLTAALTPAVVPLTFASSIAVNAALGNVFAVTLTSSAGTLASPSNPADGQVVRVRVTQGGGGGFTLAYGSAYDFGTAGPPALSASAGKTDILSFIYSAALGKQCFLGASLGF